MGKTHKCDLCEYATKNVYIFKRHRVRCKKEKKKNKSRVKSGATLFASAATAKGITISRIRPKESVCVKGTNQCISKMSDPEQTIGPIIGKAKIRSYRCSECDYFTVKSRNFLFHQIGKHDHSFSIFSCNYCEYCSKFKQKVKKHIRMVHKTNIDSSLIESLYEPKMSLKTDIDSMMLDESSDSMADNRTQFEEKKKKSNESFCNENLKGMDNFIEEIVNNTGHVNFKCKKCAFNNPDRNFVERHVNSCHINAKQFKCVLCDFTTTKKIEFIAHKAEHSNSLDVETCHLTEDTTGQKDTGFSQYSAGFLNNFSSSVTRQNESVFPNFRSGSECLSYNNEDDYNTEVIPQEQSSETVYQCPDCDYNSNFKPDFDSHRNNHINSYANKCNFCSFSSDNDRAIITHMATNHSSLDEDITVVIPQAPEDEQEAAMEIETNRGTVDYAQMDIEMPELQPSTVEPTVNVVLDDSKEHIVAKYSYKLQAPDGSYACPVCGLKYKRSWDLDRHMKLKHNKRMKNHLIQMLEEEKSKIKNLEIVDGTSDYQELESTDDTIRNDGTFTSEDLKCKYCTYVGKWPSDMKKHTAVHTLEKRYKCPECARQYKYVGDLNVHLRRDHKVEPGNVPVLRVPTIPNKKSSPAVFKCPSCPYASPWKSEVDRHSRKHIDDKPYRCKYCNYQTHWKGDIRRHMFKHHPSVMKEGVNVDSVITILHNKIRDKKQSQLDTFTDGEVNISSMDDQSETNDSILSENDYQLHQNSDLYGQIEYGNDDSNLSMNTDTSIGNLDGNNSTVDSEARSNSVSPSPSKETVFKCEHCTFVTNAPSKLSAHVSTHTNLKQYMCPVCGRRANWKWDIRKHIRKDHPESDLDVVKMSEQEAEATIKSYMDTMPVVRREHHLNYEEKSQEKNAESETYNPKWKGYRCASCGFKSNLRWTVSRHIRTVHNGQAIDIIYCPENGVEQTANPPSKPETDVEAEISKKVPVSKPYACAVCRKRCAVKADVKKHYHYIHPYMDVKIIHISESGEKLLSQEEVKSVKGSSSREEKSSREENQSFSFYSDPQKPYGCGEPNCEKRTNNLGDMKRHYSFMHPNTEVKYLYLNDTTPQKVPVGESPAPSSKSSTPTSVKSLSSANPKVFGYTKPFKCSYCGHRSNWKWDLNKHMRMKHPSVHSTIITLSEEEAKATYAEYMKEYTRLNLLQTQKKKTALRVPVVKNKDDNDGKLPCRSIFREFKCSACPYRSNWRSDLIRHIKRKHGMVRAKLILLSKEEAKQTLTEYEYNPKRFRNAAKKLGLHKSQSKYGDKKDSGKIWKCGKCQYYNKDKISVLKHLSTHGVKAYKCNECGYATNYRSSAFRHIKAKHGTESMSVCKISIKYVKDENCIQENETMDEEHPEKPEEDENEVVGEDSEDSLRFIESFNCKLCSFQASWRSSVCRHIRQTHKTKDYTNLINVVHKYYQPEEKKTGNPTDKVHISSNEKCEKPVDAKKHKCNICPYKTSKPNLLHFHMSCHKPQPGIQQEKCKFCPYYVVARRLLHQHMRLHLQDMYVRQKEAANIKSTPTKTSMFPPQSPSGTPKRHKCHICPYTTNSKNDFLYHKQFHRQRSSSEFKCDYCDYWVTHRRLINQHMKMHEAAGKSPAQSSSVSSSPCKSDITESSALQDTVTLAMYKQRMISSKITASISQKPSMSPMKIACSVGNRPSYALKNGVYKKLHSCEKCPYMNLRLRNLRLHQLMHGYRKSKSPLLKCPHCDYYVGSKGLLSHHLKVHQPNYRAETSVDLSLDLKKGDEDGVLEEMNDSNSEAGEIPYENKVDTLFEISRWKKFSCEKCPYASAKKTHYERHVALHGSKQRCQCKYCDYSVPSNNLLHQHQKLHMMPNQNLLAVQSLTNLQLLSDVPADVALSSALPPLDKKGTFSVSVTHDHMGMYENSPELDLEPKKLYRCDRCPYANVRRDHLLAHLKFHMIKSQLACPYCDYSVSKQHLLTQHIGVHFCPLPELSNWLVQNGEIDRMKQTRNPDITEALLVAELYRSDGCGRVRASESEDAMIAKDVQIENIKNEDCQEDAQVEMNKKVTNSINNNESVPENQLGDNVFEVKEENVIKKDTIQKVTDSEVHERSTNNSTASGLEVDRSDDTILEATEIQPNDTLSEMAEVKPNGSQLESEEKQKNNGTSDRAETQPNEYICQYCEREFPDSEVLVKHEMQHLVGNNFEEYMSHVQLLSELSDEDDIKSEMNEENTEMMEDVNGHIEEDNPGIEDLVEDHEETDDEVSFKKDSTIDEYTEDSLVSTDVEMKEDLVEEPQVEDDGVMKDEEQDIVCHENVSNMQQENENEMEAITDQQNGMEEN